MRYRLAIISLIVLGLAVSLLGVAPTLYTYPGDSFLTDVETLWQSAPTSADDAIAETIWLNQLSLGCAGTPRTVTITDKQGTPVGVLTAVPLSANSVATWVFPSKGTRLDGGFTIVASGVGVTYQFSGKVRR
jgi:hypothetical protein